MSVCLCIGNASLQIGFGRYVGFHANFLAFGIFFCLGCARCSLIWDNNEAIIAFTGDASCAGQ